MMDDDLILVVREAFAKRAEADHAPQKAALIRAGKWDDITEIVDGLIGARAAISSLQTPTVDVEAMGLREALEIAYRRAGGLPRLARTAEGRNAIIQIAVNECKALQPKPTRPDTGERDAALIASARAFAIQPPQNGTTVGKLLNELADAIKSRTPPPTSETKLREALERIAKLTPQNANARTASDLFLTVRAIAETALESDGND